MNTVLPGGWPEGRTLAVSVSVMLEGWSEGAAPGVGSMGNVLKAGTLDLQGRSWADYGAKAGAWRLLDVLAAERVRAVFYVSGVLAEQYPDLMQAIVNAGHVLAAHGWSQHIVPATQDEAAERADLQRCLVVPESATRSGWDQAKADPPRGPARSACASTWPTSPGCASRPCRTTHSPACRTASCASSRPRRARSAPPTSAAWWKASAWPSLRRCCAARSLRRWTTRPKCSCA